MRLNECEAEDDYDVINPFLKALAGTILKFSKPTDGTGQAPYSPRQFLHELANLHQREILFSKRSAETSESHREEVVLLHDTLAALVDGLD